jgi:signal peptidase I
MHLLRLLVTLLTIALVGVWFLTLRPVTLGGPAAFLIVNGKSMEPGLYTDDLVITRAQDSYAVGDVVGFRVGGGNVIHRIIGGDAEQGFITQGDNRPSADRWKPTASEVIGKQWLRIPNGGAYIRALHQPKYFALFVGGVCLFMLAGEIGRRGRPGPAPRRPRVRLRLPGRPPSMAELYAADLLLSYAAAATQPGEPRLSRTPGGDA